MLLPVLALYAGDLEGATPMLIGLAIGVYGLTQAGLQIPFGQLSDRFGRKPVIATGLLIFALGSIVAALSDSIVGVIIGRALQGAGAISAAIMALAADLTREDQRTKAMAIIGISIGASFLFAFMLGPFLSGFIGVSGLFWLAAVLAFSALIVLFLLVPNPEHSTHHRECQSLPSQIGDVLHNHGLLRLNVGIFSLHLVITACFVVIPLILRDNLLIAPADHWHVYIPILISSIVIMGPFLSIAERKSRVKTFFIIAILLLSLSLLLLAFLPYSLYPIATALVLFFTAFNFLEANLPSLVSRTASADNRGTALGVYSTGQFLGTFLGGILGGWFYGSMGPGSVFAGCAFITSIWFLIAWGMDEPESLKNHILNVGDIESAAAQRLGQKLLGLRGVKEAIVIAEEGVAYLKIDPRECDKEQLQTVVSNFS